MERFKIKGHGFHQNVQRSHLILKDAKFVCSHVGSTPSLWLSVDGAMTLAAHHERRVAVSSTVLDRPRTCRRHSDFSVAAAAAVCDAITCCCTARSCFSFDYAPDSMTVDITEAGQGHGWRRMLLWQSSFIYVHVHGLHTLRIFILLEARLQSNIGNALGHVSTVVTHSAITVPKMNRFGWNLEHSDLVHLIN